ncbi:MAG: hypothetical protein KBG85_12965 [Micropruina sp.]|nr:hypothetical protein [Micropruina sp.]
MATTGRCRQGSRAAGGVLNVGGISGRLSRSRGRVCLYGDGISDEETMMKYMLLIHHGHTANDTAAWDALSKEEQRAVYADYAAVDRTPGVTPGDGLDAAEMATTVRVENGKPLVTDGPFVDVKEAIGGFLFFEADDLDAAIELAARIPAARLGGAVEIRPTKRW